MGKFKRYKYHIFALMVLISMLLVGARTRTAHVTRSAEELPKVGRVYQSEQALELLLGANASLMPAAKSNQDRREFILSFVKEHLSRDQEDNAFNIARAVILEANRQQMDPFFLLAVISTESKFDIEARGTHGEIGLMQILPKTAASLAKEASLPETFDLENPSINIRLGAIYLAHLRHSFKKHGRRYVAAYNMGSLNVRRLIANKLEPEIYPGRVLGNYAQIYLSMHDIPVMTAGKKVASRSRDVAFVH